MRRYKFRCGCSFEIINEINDELRIRFTPDISELNLECQATWDLIGEGNTKAVFQLETQLGQSLSKKLKPENIEQLSALISIMRPGVMEAKLEGKSLTQKYIDRKNKIEPVTYYHPSLEEILKPTYGILVYQESVIKIAKKLAGFNLIQANTLRKSLGKKDTEKMAQTKNDFIEGCKITKIVNDKEAEEIFGWILKGQRYLFNRSHSVSYALLAYMTAYCKAHFPLAFFTSYLYNAADKGKTYEEIQELVRNARGMDISIKPHDFRILNKRFSKIGQDVYFGATDIKGIGNSLIDKVNEKISELEIILGSKDNWAWEDMLFFFMPSVSVVAAKAFAGSGSLDYYKKSRTSMLYEIDLLNKLTGRELRFVQEKHLVSKFESLETAINYLLASGAGKQAGMANKSRIPKIDGILKSIKKPPYSMIDQNEWLLGTEISLYGLPITASKLDECNTSEGNCTIREFLNGKTGYCLIPAQIVSIREHTTQNGKSAGRKMAFISVCDETDSMESVLAFAEIWEEFKDILIPGCAVMLCGERGKNDGFILKNTFFLSQKLETAFNPTNIIVQAL